MEFSYFSFSVDELLCLQTHTHKSKVNQSRKTFRGSFSTIKRDMIWIRWFSFHSWTNAILQLSCSEWIYSYYLLLPLSQRKRWSFAYGWLAVVFTSLSSTTQNKINIIKMILGRWLIGTPQLHQSIRFYIKFIFDMAVEHLLLRAARTHARILTSWRIKAIFGLIQMCLLSYYIFFWRNSVCATNT